MVVDEGFGQADHGAAQSLLDRMPFGVLIYRLSQLLFANRAFLDWSGYPNLESLVEAGGTDGLMVAPGAIKLDQGGGGTFAIASPRDEADRAEGHLLQVDWQGDAAFALVTIPRADAAMASSAALAQARAEIGELSALVELAADGVVMIDGNACIVSLNRGAQALFGYGATELAGRLFADLLASNSIELAHRCLDGLRHADAAGPLADAHEIVGRERQGRLIPLVVTFGRVGARGDRFCALFRRDAGRQAAPDLTAAPHQTELESGARSESLARMPHEIRAPLNAIIAFSAAMMEERFGPVGDDRYGRYLQDIHAAGATLITLINDLLDMSKVEAGKLDLFFTSIPVNDLIQQCVAIMQPEANRERIIVRTSLSQRQPLILADARSVRQVMLNVLSDSIKSTAAGGHVIVSSALGNQDEVIVRIRDSGPGTGENVTATATQPEAVGTGLRLPLSKALAQANGARFAITSNPDSGTLVELTFPAVRIAAAE
jgi:PAS domain S-box-containing protein